jgi:hypothetical protein
MPCQNYCETCMGLEAGQEFGKRCGGAGSWMVINKVFEAGIKGVVHLATARDNRGDRGRPELKPKAP